MEGKETRYCPVCGVEVSSPVEVRFGEAFCSLPHAEQFVKEVKEARTQAAVARAVQSGQGEVQQPDAVAACALTQRDWRRYLKVGVCAGVLLLALAFLAGGGGAVLGAAGVLLPLLAFLACPLAMYFMMRSMAKMEHHEHPTEKGGRELNRRSPENPKE